MSFHLLKSVPVIERGTKWLIVFAEMYFKNGKQFVQIARPKNIHHKGMGFNLSLHEVSADIIYSTVPWLQLAFLWVHENNYFLLNQICIKLHNLLKSFLDLLVPLLQFLVP